jgi:hypothetical protein
MISALAVGIVCAVGIAWLGFTALQASWPEYAAAVPEKAYTLPMLWSRLGLAVVLTVVSAAAATLIARDRRAAWVLGLLLVAVSLPSHLHYSWAHYPVWYHALYLLSLVPISLLGGRLVPQRLVSPRLTTPAAQQAVADGPPTALFN